MRYVMTYVGGMTDSLDAYELEMTLCERHYVVGFGAIGPLTEDQSAAEQAYDLHMAETEAEYNAQEAAGGREICPECNHRSVLSRDVLTYGVRGRAGSEYSALRECERVECSYTDLAG